MEKLQVCRTVIQASLSTSRMGFSVQIDDHNPFDQIPFDHTMEERGSKDTHTAAGTQAFSLKQGTVSKYHLTAEYCSTDLKNRTCVKIINKYTNLKADH